MARSRRYVALLLLFATALAWSLAAADRRPAPAPATPATRPSADDVMRDLLQQRKESPLLEPTRRSVINPATSQPQLPHSAVLGVAPGGAPPKLRREGEFVVSRRGRIVRAPGGGQMIFVFDADARQAPEPPMFVVPCQLLQSMEDVMAERGDRLIFKVSGQVLAYRGANYLLPTMMAPETERGNLQH